MQKIVYGRSPSMVAKHEREQSYTTISTATGLIYREMQDRPENESRLRGCKTTEW